MYACICKLKAQRRPRRLSAKLNCLGDASVYNINEKDKYCQEYFVVLYLSKLHFHENGVFK